MIGDRETSLAVVGCGAHGRKVAQAVIAGGGRVARFLDDAAAPSPVANIPREALAPATAAPGEVAIIAIGAPSVRERLSGELARRGFRIATVVHPRAMVAPDATLGVGVVVLAGAIVESGARVGDGAIVDVGAIVDHDAQVGAFCHVRPGAVVHAYTVLNHSEDPSK